MKQCRKCKELKPWAEYYRDKAAKTGLMTICKICSKEECRVWAQKNKTQRFQYGRRLYARQRATMLCRNARQRARRKGLAYDLDDHIQEIQLIIDNGCCELTGIPFDTTYRYGTHRMPINPRSPSLDRIDPTKGYVRDNVQVVLSAVNVMKSNWGMDEVVEIVSAYMRMIEQPLKRSA